MALPPPNMYTEVCSLLLLKRVVQY